MRQHTNQLAHILLSTKVISAPKLQRGIELAEQQERPLLPTLISQGILSAETICQTCASYYQLEKIDLSNYSSQHLSQEWIDQYISKNRLIFPITDDPDFLKIALCDPDDLPLIEEMQFRHGVLTKPVFANYTDLSNLLISYLNKHHLNASTPIVTLVEQIITDAIMQRASDIHFEPIASQQLRIRLRIDGLLHTTATLSPDQVKAVISRLKIMSELDIALQRLPQDGRFTFKTKQGLICDCRISTCPTLLGEKVVIRLLDSSQQLLDIHELGLNDNAKHTLLHALSQPQGLILVTGPTGSGKTQTLYSSLMQLRKDDLNIVTIEDPVEIQLPGINQVHVNEKSEFDFGVALRAFLRQDPDVILIGEIRDLDTAHTAIRASQTGHLVLSTLHTNSASETLTRLENLGIHRYQIMHSITCIVAQRLARRLCEHCKLPYEMNQKEWLSLNPDSSLVLSSPTITLYRANSCNHCLNGYRGRAGLFEIIPLASMQNSALLTDHNLLKNMADPQWKNIKIQTLWQAGLEKVMHGITSLQEINRVLQHE